MKAYNSRRTLPSSQYGLYWNTNVVATMAELESLFSSDIPPSATSKLLDSVSRSFLEKIEAQDKALKQQFEARLQVQPALTRQLVSFQASKTCPAYRWFKYKEAFSAALVQDLLQRNGISFGQVLDPFAGSGTTLFAASALGLNATGIELLPIGVEIIRTRQLIERELTSDEFEALDLWRSVRPWRESAMRGALPMLNITAGAYPSKTLDAIERYLGALANESSRVQNVLRLALLCILESISYTRKDGQYLRWDYRSGRRQGAKPFNKGVILDFDQAITAKLNEMLGDVRPIDTQTQLFELDQGVAAPGQLRIL